MPSVSRRPTIGIYRISRLAVLSLFAGVLSGCGSSKEKAGDADKQLAEVQVALQRIERELIGLQPGVPKESEQKIKGLESILSDPKQWPQQLDQVEKLRQELDGVVQSLPPLAAERVLPQLVRLNWAVEALWCLRMPSDVTNDQLENAPAIITEVLERQPKGHFEEFQKELAIRLKQLEPQVRKYRIGQLLERARLALANQDDAAAVYSSLEEYRGEAEVTEIMPLLRSKVFEDNCTERMVGLAKTLERTRSFADDRARQLSLLNIQDGFLRLGIELELEVTASKELSKRTKELLAKCDKELLALAAKQQQEYAKKHRRYQEWALNEILKFDGPQGWYYDTTLPWVESELKLFQSATEDGQWVAFNEFPSLKELVQEKLGVDLSGAEGGILTADKRREIYDNARGTVVGWKNNIHTEIAYRATRDAMVKFLLPIQPQLLDSPVAQLYQQAFSKGWQKLEGREDQLFVAQQSAIIQKKALDE